MSMSYVYGSARGNVVSVFSTDKKYIDFTLSLKTLSIMTLSITIKNTTLGTTALGTRYCFAECYK